MTYTNLKMNSILAAPIVLALMTVQSGPAQSKDTPPAPARSFEVASIKPSDPAGFRNVQIQIAPGGRFVTKNTSIKMLIEEAYDVKDFQISGGPDWLNSTRYDIVAKADGEGEVRREQLRPMLQALLADRFKLTFHRDSKELPIYALVLGKNGSKMKQSEPLPEGTAPGPGPGKGTQMRMGRGDLNAQRAPMTMLATLLARELGRNVIDRTGLKGEFDFTLQWTPDRGEGPGGPGEGGADHPAPSVDSSGPSLFTALQEQLGLRLESQKGPVDTFIVDRIEKATEN